MLWTWTERITLLDVFLASSWSDAISTGLGSQRCAATGQCWVYDFLWQRWWRHRLEEGSLKKPGIQENLWEVIQWNWLEEIYSLSDIICFQCISWYCRNVMCTLRLYQTLKATGRWCNVIARRDMFCFIPRGFNIGRSKVGLKFLSTASLSRAVQWQSLKELRQLLLTTMALTAVSLDLPMNYFDDYFTLEKQQQANDVCGVHPGWVRNRTLFTLEKAAWEPWTWTSWIFFCFSWFLVVVFSTYDDDCQNEMTLRLAYYPAYEKGAEPLPGQLRYGEHTDFTGGWKHVKQVFWWGPPFGNPGIPVRDGIQLFCWFFDLSHPAQDQCSCFWLHDDWPVRAALMLCRFYASLARPQYRWQCPKRLMSTFQGMETETQDFALKGSNQGWNCPILPKICPWKFLSFLNDVSIIEQWWISNG